MEHDPDRSPLCPSAQPAMEGSVVFGVVGGTSDEPRVAYLTDPQAAGHQGIASLSYPTPLSVVAAGGAQPLRTLPPGRHREPSIQPGATPRGSAWRRRTDLTHSVVSSEGW